MNTIAINNRVSKLRIARAVSLAASAVLTFGLLPSARADTTYIYTGNIYNQLGGTYQSGGPYALSVEFTTTLTGNALDNLAFSDITGTVTSYNFSDGSGLTLNNNNNGLTNPYLEIEVATGASGNITQWFVGAYTYPANIQMQSNWQSPYGFIPGADFSETTPNFAGDYGFVGSDPGTWRIVSVPEPSVVALALFCVCGLGFLRQLRTPSRRNAQEFLGKFIH